MKLDSSHADRSHETRRFYHGTRDDLKPGDLIHPRQSDQRSTSRPAAAWVHLTPDLDGAIWEAEIASGEGPGRVFVMEPLGPVEVDDETEHPGHPWMSWHSPAPLRVVEEINEWTYYHGTKAELQAGDLIAPGHQSNYGQRKDATFVYFTATLDAAIWGAELAAGEGSGRIYEVEPTGPVEDDPNLTDARFRGNPTRSLRSREPLRVTGEVRDWQAHPADVVEAMKEGLRQLENRGIEPLDD